MSSICCEKFNFISRKIEFVIKNNDIKYLQGGQNVRIVRIVILTLKLYGLYELYGFVFK